MLPAFNRCYPSYGLQQYNGVLANHQQQKYPTSETRKAIDHYSYALNEEIGRGFSSKVYKGRDENNHQPVAVKVIDMKMVKQSIHSVLLKNEINALKSLNCQNILKLYDVFQTSNNTYIITEFCDSVIHPLSQSILKGDLHNYIKKKGKIDEQEAIRIFNEICQGMMEMNRKNFIHRDIKPANILLDKTVPKIADFGFAMNCSDIKQQTKNYNVGTPLYMSPQALRQQGSNEKGDVWAMGVMFFEMLFGRSPFNGHSEAGLLANIMHQGLQIPSTPAISDLAKDFIRKCLQVEEYRRLSIKEMCSHKLVNSYAIQQVVPDERKIRRSHSQGQKENEPKPIKNENVIVNKKVEFQSNNILTNNTNNNITVDRGNKRAPTEIFMMNAQNDKKQKDVTRSKSQKHVFDQKNYSIQEVAPSYQQQPTVQPIVEQTNPIKFKTNNDILFSQINYCRFLYKFSQQILSKQNTLNLSAGLKEKITFLISKNITIKINRLQLLNEKENQRENIFGLEHFEEYRKSDSFQKFSQAIVEYNEKYKKHFTKMFSYIAKQGVLTDKKFEAFYDKDLNEFESFYFITQSYLKQCLNELKNELLQQIEQKSDFNFTCFVTEGIKDYLQLITQTLEAKGDYRKFKNNTQIEQLVERKIKIYTTSEAEQLLKSIQDF